MRPTTGYGVVCTNYSSQLQYCKWSQYFESIQKLITVPLLRTRDVDVGGGAEEEEGERGPSSSPVFQAIKDPNEWLMLKIL